jgi:hypothetical protein
VIEADPLGLDPLVVIKAGQVWNKRLYDEGAVPSEVGGDVFEAPDPAIRPVPTAGSRAGPAPASSARNATAPSVSRARAATRSS